MLDYYGCGNQFKRLCSTSEQRQRKEKSEEKLVTSYRRRETVLTENELVFRLFVFFCIEY